MIPSILVSIIVLSFVLIKSADMVIVAIRRLSKQTHTKVFTIAALVLALSTSFPELFVGITSALEGAPQLSLGVITGSNIANISLVVGLTAFVTGRVRVHGNYLKRDVLIALVAGMMPFVLLFDLSLSRIDGLILLALYFGYATSFFKDRFMQIARKQQEERFIYRFIRKFSHIDGERRKELGRFFVGIALMLFSADAIVKLATYLASLANIPSFVIGLILVAISTSMPEFAFSLRSLKEHEPSMFFGNILGSTITNSTLVIGIVAIIHPIEVLAVNEYMVAVAAFIIIFASFWYFIRSKHRLDRWEAGLLLVLYLSFVIATFI